MRETTRKLIDRLKDSMKNEPHQKLPETELHATRYWAASELMRETGKGWRYSRAETARIFGLNPRLLETRNLDSYKDPKKYMYLSPGEKNANLRVKVIKEYGREKDIRAYRVKNDRYKKWVKKFDQKK